MKQPLVHIGWCEYVDIPEWDIYQLRAKADTGARSSSLHVENLIELPHRKVSFEVILHRHRRDRRVQVVAPIARQGRVRSSIGVSAERHFVSCTIQLGSIEREIELNLVDRGQMIYRMLLGRSALSGLLVDPSRQYMFGKRKPRHKKTGS